MKLVNLPPMGLGRLSSLRSLVLAFFRLWSYRVSSCLSLFLGLSSRANSASSAFIYLAPYVGTKHTLAYRFSDKELYGTYSLDDNYQQCSGRRVATNCPGEAGPNPHGSSGTSHQIESRS